MTPEVRERLVDRYASRAKLTVLFAEFGIPNAATLYKELAIAGVKPNRLKTAKPSQKAATDQSWTVSFRVESTVTAASIQDALDSVSGPGVDPLSIERE